MNNIFDPEAAGNLLSELAERHGYSLRRLAELAGVHNRTVTNYANGGRDGRPLRNPNKELWLRVAVVFGPDDGAKLMETCGLDLFAEALRRFTIDDDGEIGGLEFLPQFQRPRVGRIIKEVSNRATGVYVRSLSRPGPVPVAA